jgi:hypothetical protein
VSVLAKLLSRGLVVVGAKSDPDVNRATLWGYSLSEWFVILENRLIFAAIIGSASAKTVETTLSAILGNVEDSEA